MPTITAREPVPTSAPVEPQVKTLHPRQQTPAVEEKIESPVIAEAKAEQLSPKFAQLARKEKALRMEQQKIQEEKKAMQAKLAEYEASYIPKSKLSDLAKNNPLAFLEQSGITADEFTQALINSSPQDASIAKLQARIDAIENGQKETVSKFEQQQRSAYDQAVNQIRNDAKILIDADPTYETIKETNSVEAIVELIKATFDETGNLLSLEEAAKEVEEYLVEKAFEMTKLKKIRQKLMPQPPVEAQKPLAPTPKVPSKTLTHSMTASAKRLTPQERRERAIAAMSGQLK